MNVAETFSETTLWWETCGGAAPSGWMPTSWLERTAGLVCSAKSLSEQRGCKQLNVGLSAKTTVKTESENERSRKLKW